MYFIEHRSIITSNYYIERIIEPPGKYDIPHLFSNAIEKKMVLHQDSAPSHVAEDIMSFMKEHNSNVMMPHE